MTAPDVRGLRRVTPDEQRAVLLELMTELDRWCTARNLTYYLYAGTLLGAVRHQGFIPWDDDIDVMMPRADYEVLCRDFPTTGDVHQVSPNTARTYPYAYAKICRAGTLVREDVVLAPADRFGINIDVIPIDRVSRHPARFRWHARMAMAVRALLLLKVVEARSAPTPRVRRGLRVAQVLLRPVPTRWLTRTRTTVARVVRRHTGTSGMLVASVPWSLADSDLEPATDVSFEGLLLPGPANPDALLSQVYGDYMALPPEDRRIPPHPSTAYWLGPEGPPT